MSERGATVRPWYLPILALAALLAAVSVADAAFPPDPPNDPLYTQPNGCPPVTPTLACSVPAGQWNLFSFWPNNPPNPGHASGISADLAWNVTTGRPDVVAVVLDSGVNYDHEDLRNKIWLNRGELPAPNGPACTPPLGDPYDCNADGAFDIRDYSGDTRITDTVLPGALTRSDLRVFEDGVDGDGDGFVDDISGFDTRDTDGDEYRTNGEGHGTGRNGFIAAEANNGKGIAGICPRCQLANVRVEGTFVVRTEGVGLGAIWAADQGHEVINMALGGTGASSMTRAAFDYATRKNVLSLNAMANEFSFHQNFQTVFDDVMGIGAVVPDTSHPPGQPSPESEVHTYLRKANFSNYGAHMDVVAPSDAPTTSGGGGYGDSSGTSSAVPHASGVAALVYSRARELIDASVLDASGLALQDISAQEVRQIIDRSADDVVKTDDPAGPYNYLTGWDRWTGYGRINAKSAVDMVGAGTIPPEADINSPDWYSQVNGVVPIQFYANARWASAYDWVLEYGAGVEPSSFSGIASSAGETSDPSLSSADLASNFTRDWAAGALPDGFYTLRLTVTDDLGNVGEDRMGVWLQQPDPQDHPGFPVHLPASLESTAGGSLVDLDGDNTLEIIISDGDGRIHALRQDGSEMPGFPVMTDPVWVPSCCSDAFDGNPANGEVPVTGASTTGGVTVADIDADGMQEICAGAYDGKVYCWKEDATRQPGFPVETDKGITVDQYSGVQKINARGEGVLVPPAVGDLDGDGKLELVAGAFDQKLYIWRSDGTRFAPWPKQIFDAGSSGGVNVTRPKEIVSLPLIADIDADGVQEIVFGTNETYSSPNVAGQGGSGRMYAYEPDGTLEPGWPVKPASLTPSAVPLVADGIGTSPVAADIDGDGTLEIAIGVLLGDPMIYNHDGTVFRTMNGALSATGPGGDGEETTPEGGLGKASDSPTHYYVAGSAFADVDGDTVPDYLTGTIGTGIAAFALGDGNPTPFDLYFSVFNSLTGAHKPAFPRVIEDWQFFTGASVADIDGLPGGLPEMVASSGGYFVHAFNAAGLEASGFPKNVGQWVVMSPSIGDIDNDGALEVVVTTRMGDVHVWDMPGGVCGNTTWPKARHDEWNSGVLGRDTHRTAAVTDLASDPAGLLQWTAPGDDGDCGQAHEYEIRFSYSPLTEQNWTAARLVEDGVPTPATVGSAQQLPCVAGAGYFGVRAIDESGNMGPLSNVVQPPDGDADGLTDSCDPCPANPDCDADSAGLAQIDSSNVCQTLGVPLPFFRDCIERFVGTDISNACAQTAAVNDEAVDAMPADLNDDRRVNVTDRTMMVLKIKAFVGGDYDRRFDLNASHTINVTDRTIIALFIKQLGGHPCTP